MKRDAAVLLGALFLLAAGVGVALAVIDAWLS